MKTSSKFNQAAKLTRLADQPASPFGFWELDKNQLLKRIKEEDSSNRKTLKWLGVTATVIDVLPIGFSLMEYGSLDVFDSLEVGLLALPPIYFFLASKGIVPYRKHHYIHFAEDHLSWCIGFFDKRHFIDTEKVERAEIKLFALWVQFKDCTSEEHSIELPFDDDVKWFKNSIYRYFEEQTIPVQFSKAHSGR